MHEILWTAWVVAITAAAWLPFYRTPLYQDQALHLYIGKEWLRGRIPYRDYSFALGPHLALLYAILFRWVGNSDRKIHLLSMLYLAGGNAILFWSVASAYGPAAALFASIFFAFYLFNPRFIGDRLPVESYALPPTLAAYACLLVSLGRPEPAFSLAAGFFLGVAALFRQSAYFYVLPLGAAQLCYGTVQEICWAAGGFLLIHLVWVVYFAAKGALSDYLHASLFYAVAIAFFGNAKGPGHAKSDLMRATGERVTALLKTNSMTILPLYLLALVSLFHLIFLRSDPRAVVTGLFFLTGIALIFPRWNFDCCYWLNSVPWASALGGVAGGLLWERMRAGFTFEQAVILALALGLLYYIYIFDFPKYATFDPEKRNALIDPGKQSHASWWATFDRIGAYLKETTGPGDKILILGHGARILNMAERRAFFYSPSFVLFRAKPLDLPEYRRFQAALADDYPDVIVLAGHLPAFPFNPEPYLKDLAEISETTGVVYTTRENIEGFPVYFADRERSYLLAVLKGGFRNGRLKTEKGLVTPETRLLEEGFQRGEPRAALRAYVEELDRKGRYGDAIFALQAVINLSPGQADPGFTHALLISLGELQYKNGAAAEAEKTFRGTLGIFPRSHQALNNLGFIRYQAGQRDEARSCFLQALEADPQNADARANLEALDSP